MKIVIGSDRARTLDRVFRESVAEAMSDPGCEVVVVMEDATDAFEFLVMLEESGKDGNLVSSSANETVVEFGNKSVMKVVGITHFLEKNARFKRFDKRSLYILCDYYYRLNYAEFPSIAISLFRDMRIYQYYAVNLPEKRDFIDIDCDYGSFLGRNLGMQHVRIGINCLNSVCIEDSGGEYIVVCRSDARRFCHYCGLYNNDGTHSVNCVVVGDKMVACRKCKYYAELLLNCLNNDEKENVAE